MVTCSKMKERDAKIGNDLNNSLDLIILSEGNLQYW